MRNSHNHAKPERTDVGHGKQKPAKKHAVKTGHKRAPRTHAHDHTHDHHR